MDYEKQNNEESEKIKSSLKMLSVDVESEKKKIVLMSEVFNKTEKKVSYFLYSMFLSSNLMH